MSACASASQNCLDSLLDRDCDCCPPCCPPSWVSLEAWIEFMERMVKVVEPVFAILAAGLVSLDAFIFFTTVITEVGKASGPSVAGMHAAFGAWLLFNIMFNHAMCVWRSPGTTLEADAQELRLAMTPAWRWCNTCERAKPPLSHHCSICDKCVLKMDHHCVWMSNCIGFQNYRYFFLYVFYMWAGSAYSAVMTLVALRLVVGPGATLDDVLKSPDLALVFLVLAMSTFIGLSALLGWHVWLVLTGSGTIEAMSLTLTPSKAQKKSNPYNLGVLGNFRETFDAHGRLWWLTWMMPSRRRKRGNGYQLPRRARQLPARPNGVMDAEEESGQA